MNHKHTLHGLTTPASGLALLEQLAQQAADAVRELLAEAAAANTTRSYAAALRYWAGWHQARFGVELTLPVSEAAVIQFLVDHIRRKNKIGLFSELPPAIDQTLVAAGLKAKVGPLKLATVVQRVAVLSTAHKLKRRTNPCELASVRTLLSRARRAAVKRGERPTKKTAITRPELEAMLATCDDTFEGLRDRALLCFGFASGGRRRSEIAAADLRDLLKASPDKAILGRSAQALSAWLEAAGIRVGAIFRRIWRDRVGPALLPGSVAAIVKRRAKLAGLEGNFGAHSLRSGIVTEAGKQGVPLPAVMAMTEHRSVASVIGYFQQGAAEDNPAARLLKSPVEKLSANELASTSRRARGLSWVEVWKASRAMASAKRTWSTGLK